MYLLLLMGLVILPANSVYSMDSLKGAQSSQTKTTQTGLFKKLIAAYPTAFEPASAPFDMATLPDILLLAKAVQPKQGKGKKSTYATLVEDKTGVLINGYDGIEGGIESFIINLRYYLDNDVSAGVRLDKLNSKAAAIFCAALTQDKLSELQVYLQGLADIENAQIRANQRRVNQEIAKRNSDSLDTLLAAYTKTLTDDMKLFDTATLPEILRLAKLVLPTKQKASQGRLTKIIANTTGININKINDEKNFINDLTYYVTDSISAQQRLDTLHSGGVNIIRSNRAAAFRNGLTSDKLTALRTYLNYQIEMEPLNQEMKKRGITADKNFKRLQDDLFAYDYPIKGRPNELPFDMGRLQGILSMGVKAIKDNQALVIVIQGVILSITGVNIITPTQEFLDIKKFLNKLNYLFNDSIPAQARLDSLDADGPFKAQLDQTRLGALGNYLDNKIPALKDSSTGKRHELLSEDDDLFNLPSDKPANISHSGATGGKEGSLVNLDSNTSDKVAQAVPVVPKKLNSLLDGTEGLFDAPRPSTMTSIPSGRPVVPGQDPQKQPFARLNSDEDDDLFGGAGLSAQQKSLTGSKYQWDDGDDDLFGAPRPSTMTSKTGGRPVVPAETGAAAQGAGAMAVEYELKNDVTEAEITRILDEQDARDRLTAIHVFAINVDKNNPTQITLLENLIRRDRSRYNDATMASSGVIGFNNLERKVQEKTGKTVANIIANN